MHIGDQIKQRRKELKLTQNELAKKLNVSRSTVANWEQKRNNPDFTTIKAISEQLEIPLELLVDSESYQKKEFLRNKSIIQKKKKQRILFIILVIILIIFSGFKIYSKINYIEMSNPDQIKTVEYSNNKIDITFNLPPYRSIAGYILDNDPTNPKVIRINIIEFLNCKNDEKLTIKLDETFNRQYEEIHFLYKTDVIKKIPLTTR